MRTQVKNTQFACKAACLLALLNIAQGTPILIGTMPHMGDPLLTYRGEGSIVKSKEVTLSIYAPQAGTISTSIRFQVYADAMGRAIGDTVDLALFLERDFTNCSTVRLVDTSSIPPQISGNPGYNKEDYTKYSVPEPPYAGPRLPSIIDTCIVPRAGYYTITYRIVLDSVIANGNGTFGDTSGYPHGSLRTPINVYFTPSYYGGFKLLANI